MISEGLNLKAKLTHHFKTNTMKKKKFKKQLIKFETYRFKRMTGDNLIKSDIKNINQIVKLYLKQIK